MSILTSMQLLPLIGALVVAILPASNAKLVKQVALAFSLLVMLVSIVMALGFDRNNSALQFIEVRTWISAFNINYAVGIDGMALVLILMTTILVPIVFLAGWNESENGRWNVKVFYILLLILAFDIARLSQLTIDSTTQNWLFLGFFIAFAIKAPLWPFHTWLPTAAKSATAGTSTLLLGVLDKVGTYGMIRFCMSFFPDATKTFTPYIITLAVISILYGAFLAIGQKDINSLIAFTSISHFGFITLGIFALTSQSLTGAIFYMVNHGFGTAALFLTAGWMIKRRGSSQIADLSFVSEFLVLLGSYAKYPVAAILGTLGIILAALYVLLAVQRAIHGETPASSAGITDLNLREKIAIAPVIAVLVVLGFYPKPALEVINPTTQTIMTNAGVSDPVAKVVK